MVQIKTKPELFSFIKEGTVLVLILERILVWVLLSIVDLSTRRFASGSLIKKLISLCEKEFTNNNNSSNNNNNNNKNNIVNKITRISYFLSVTSAIE
jgi:hypothetical protein